MDASNADQERLATAIKLVVEAKFCRERKKAKNILIWPNPGLFLPNNFTEILLTSKGFKHGLSSRRQAC